MATKRKKQGGNKQNFDECAFKNGGNGNSNHRNCKKAGKRQQQQQKFMNENDYRLRLQEVLFNSDYILQKIFRKDGPALGVEFDSLPENAFRYCRPGSRKSHRTCQENQRTFKRQKVSTPLDYQACPEPRSTTIKHGIGKGLMAKNGTPVKRHGIGKGLMTKKSAPMKKHGIGKGLMTVWRVTNPDGGDFPTGIGSSTFSNFSLLAKKKSLQRRQSLMRKLGKRLQEKKKASVRCRKEIHGMGASGRFEQRKQARKEKCELALEGLTCEENLDQLVNLVDDEELELKELQAGPNPLSCSAHLATNGSHGCSLCKDLLAKFPPDSVVMKRPLYGQPWDSSPELVKKLFKVFHFLCTYALKIDVCSFTFDEFAQGFQDKDSLLLGQVHLALLKVLLSDIEMELNSGFFSHSSKNSKFLELLHSIDQEKFLLELWQRALNALTWTEILRQVLVAAGFGSKCVRSPGEARNKEVSLMAKYGLSPGTLKGELFSVLLNHGNNGLKVSELTKIPSIAELNIAATADKLELLISSTLSSDITLFERISSSGYRLRVNPAIKESENFPSDSEDFGSVDDDSDTGGGHSSAEDSECETRSSRSNKLRRRKNYMSNNMLTVSTEIDESHPGEVWLLGLMEGEYSDLSIEEKLCALLALIDLVSSGSSVRLEDPVAAITTFVPNMTQHSTGAKIKRSTAKQYNFPRQAGGYCGANGRDASSTSVLNPIDSLVLMSKTSERERSCSMRKDNREMEASEDLHPMQSIYLGSDRRYNRYWLFLGPCNGSDPGHKRIYFESSEDGNWEFIDNEEALCSLVSSLDRRGQREAFLLSSLEKRELYLCRAMSNVVNDAGIGQLNHSDQSDQNTSREDSLSAVSDVDNNLSLIEVQKDVPSGAVVFEMRKAEQQRHRWNLTQAFDRWIWKSFYSNLNAVKHGKRSYVDSLTRCEHCHDLYWRDEKHCKVCHTTFELDFDLEERYAVHTATCRGNLDVNKFPRHKVLSSQLQSLKAAICAIESVMPGDLLVDSWAKSAHNLWVKRLRRASTLAECLQVIGDFVSAINEDSFYQCDDSVESNCVMEDILSSFPTMPQTSSAFAFWLVKLDELIAPHLERVKSQNKLEVIRRLEGSSAAH
ncbi:homeobox-DDT domain protein RLT3 [Coffea eugenioides]|uniref:Homeobox-DDT domain protein RLT3-like n=1 Tax=Coffea arabica TaxID=13443 RepID=A0ABM4WSE9_COFAR|nr:homeobox-DDT domain protein RLT3 [Coffea eugenioides]